jgi:small multidrug resistance family-3 protein
VILLLDWTPIGPILLIFVSDIPARRHVFVKTFVLFAVTAVAEILGCYLPYRWLREGASAWLLVPAALSLAAFAWLLTLHPSAAGRTYAAYGGVYIAVAILWLWSVDGIRPTTWDWLGVALTLSGMAVIAFQPR